MVGWSESDNIFGTTEESENQKEKSDSFRIDKAKAYEWSNTRKGIWSVSKSHILHRSLTDKERPTKDMRTSPWSTSSYTQLIEPPYTGPYVRWCERGGRSVGFPLPIVVTPTNPHRAEARSGTGQAEGVHETILRRNNMEKENFTKLNVTGFSQSTLWSGQQNLLV